MILDGKAPPVGHSIAHHLPKLHPLLVSQQVPRASGIQTFHTVPSCEDVHQRETHKNDKTSKKCQTWKS